jgi:glycosyltransferase involved in cell wall biosynthesis
MIRPGSTGLLVPPGDVQSLGQAIFQILEDREMNAAYSVSCRKVVEQEYTPQTQARRYVELYQQLVTSG